MESKRTEASYLAKRIKVLEKYVKSEEYKSISPSEQNMCHKQLSAMKTYHICLLKRIDFFEDLNENQIWTLKKRLNKN